MLDIVQCNTPRFWNEPQKEVQAEKVKNGEDPHGERTMESLLQERYFVDHGEKLRDEEVENPHQTDGQSDEGAKALQLYTLHIYS